MTYENMIVMWTTFEAMSWELAEKYPNDPQYREWATREALMKHYMQGRGPH